MNGNVEFLVIIIAFFGFFLLYYQFAKRSKNKVVQWSLRLWPVWTVVGILVSLASLVGTNCYFKGLPGDHASITQYFSVEHYPDIRDGDGNNFLAGEESVQFWKQLEAAELIPPQEMDGAVRKSKFQHDIAFYKRWFSHTEFAEPLGIVAYSSGEKNYYQIARYKTEGELVILPSFTPEEAFNLDSKIDDGRPLSGSVIIRSAAHDGSSRLDGDITEKEAGFEAGNKYACINESDISDGKKRMTTYAIANKNLACSIRIRMN